MKPIPFNQFFSGIPPGSRRCAAKWNLAGAISKYKEETGYDGNLDPVECLGPVYIPGKGNTLHFIYQREDGDNVTFEVITS